MKSGTTDPNENALIHPINIYIYIYYKIMLEKTRLEETSKIK